MRNTLQKQGFTLIELLIAIGIFAVFITIMTGIFTNFMQTQRHAIAQGQLIADLTSAFESFIKEARTGYGSTYFVDGTGTAIAFVNQNGNCVEYRLKSNGTRGEFQRADAGKKDPCEPTLLDSMFVPMTSNATNITGVQFVPDIALHHETNGIKILDNQGRITIVLKAKSTKDGIPEITIQNSVTSRQMEPYVP